MIMAASSSSRLSALSPLLGSSMADFKEMSAFNNSNNNNNSDYQTLSNSTLNLMV